MTGAQTIMKGTIVMFTSFLIAILCVYCILIPLTTIQDSLATGGVYDVSAEWDSRDEVDTLVGYVHLCIYLLPCLGTLYFCICIIKTLRYTSEDEYSAGMTEAYQGKF